MIGEAEKEDLSQISLTGVRSLILLGLLINAPMSLEEIKKAFIGHKIMGVSASEDVIRIDINTLKKMGCDISRADHRTDNKFVLKKHPFRINITKEEVSVIKRAFNKIKENADISLLMSYDNLFKKIAEHVTDEEVKEILTGISPLNKYSQELVDRLKSACEKKNTVQLIYKAPTASKETEIEIFAEKILLQSDKLYLYGVDKGSDRPIYLNIRRILKILSSHQTDDYRIAEPVTVRFKLNHFGVSGLDDNEEIESGDIDNGFVICGHYHNTFLAMQRILSFGSECTVIEPDDFKEKLVKTLLRMKEVYNAQ